MKTLNCKQPKRVALTGTIGAGKSTVASVFADLGVPIYYSDLRARELMNTTLRESISGLLGAEVYSLDGTLNRPLVAERVFASKEQLIQLNSMVHPAVIADFREWAEGQSARYVMVETALLVESDLISHVEDVVLVIAPLDMRIARAANRDGVDRGQIERRLATQISQEELKMIANYTISTAEDDLILPQIIALHEIFLY